MRKNYGPLPTTALRRRDGSLGVVHAQALTHDYKRFEGLVAALDVVLRAAALLAERRRRDIVFLLVGDGARLDTLRRDAAQAGLDNVMFTGRLDRRQVPSVPACSHACLVHIRAVEPFECVMPSKIVESGWRRRLHRSIFDAPASSSRLLSA